MFGSKKNKPAKSPYPRQEYVQDQVQSQSQQQSGTYPMDPSSYPQPAAPYPYAPGTMMTQQYSQQMYSKPTAPTVEPSAPPQPVYGEAPPPPYSPYPQTTPYSQPSPYPQYAPYQQPSPYQQQQPYHGYPQASYPNQSAYSAPAPYPTQQMPQTVIVPGGFDAGARFNAGAAPVVPPAPPGVAPNAAQMAASQGHTVVASQKHANWFTGGTGGGGLF